MSPSPTSTIQAAKPGKPQNSFARVWKWWFTPRATDPIDIFREKANRILLTILVPFTTFGLLAAVLRQQISPIPNLFAAIVFLFISFVILSLYFLHKGKLSAAGLFILLIFLRSNFAGILNSGYWGIEIIPSFMLTIIMASLLLEAKYIIPVAIGLVGMFASFVLWLENSPYMPVTAVPIEPGYFYVIVVALFLLSAAMLLTFMRRELDNWLHALQNLISTLEDRVSERTRDLQVASDVARQITTVLDLDPLLLHLVEKTKIAFDLYFVSVFVYRPETQQLVLAAGTGETGRQMLAEGRTFHLDARPSLIAKAARDRQNIIINDVRQEEAHADNPYLPHTQSEAVLPMVVGDELIGVLGLQSEMLQRFEPDDVEIFTTLAEQIAIAVKNAQLYASQTQMAEELRKADQAKSQFLASMSHELRTPLNAIMNFTEMVALEMMGPVNADQKEVLEQSLASSQHLLNLINDVLDISKIQAGKLSLFVENDVNVYAELKTVVSMTEPLLKGKSVTLIQDIDDNLPIIAGDKRRIRQIFLNLMSNAAKFTDEGSITLSAKNRGDHLLFAVIDSGSGIAGEMQPLIFEPFRQTEDGVRHAQGTGLGLPITRSLVAAHGGQMWLESELGEGAAFYVTLPVGTAVPTL